MIGLILDFSITQETDRDSADGWPDLALNAPRYFINSGTTQLQFDWTTQPSNTVWALYFVDDPTPSDYSTTLYPSGRSEYIIDWWEKQGTSGDTDIVDGTNLTLNLWNKTTITNGRQIAPNSTPLLSEPLNTDPFTSSLINSNDTFDLERNRIRFLSVMQDGEWNGKIALTVKGWAGGAFDPNPVSTRNSGTIALSGLYSQPTHTGLNTGITTRDRIAHCDRSGLPGYAKTFTRDGYIQGAWVLPEWHEEEDRVGWDIPIPPNEGVIDDEVGD
jgi:hypothetical protein